MFKPKKILVPVDFSDRSEISLAKALEIAENVGSKVVIVHVIEKKDNDLISMYLSKEQLEKINSDIKEFAEKQMDELIAKVGTGKTVYIEKRIVFGVPYDVIVDLTEKEDFDLVVIASHGRSGLEKFFYGSTTEKVVRRAACSVLLVKEKK
ncbi:universal stress protein [Deferribacter desulfuricans SSM1]|uniref:Universal stress protein n=1 Tax=Deferribacter desulfuricans (strain DSM 14783 / JCM 11476 / NBRC 101012 / SSM1) TaxID=639282 RepID=D3PBN8_DEFDS|nr:universal stress protein [Deferribacter desulfuricans]BAI80011.1 universal stress protein [Deferribacter desulfuricans SSM1]